MIEGFDRPCDRLVATLGDKAEGNPIYSYKRGMLPLSGLMKSDNLEVIRLRMTPRYFCGFVPE